MWVLLRLIHLRLVFSALQGQTSFSAETQNEVLARCWLPECSLKKELPRKNGWVGGRNWATLPKGRYHRAKKHYTKKIFELISRLRTHTHTKLHREDCWGIHCVMFVEFPGWVISQLLCTGPCWKNRNYTKTFPQQLFLALHTKITHH